MASSVSGLNRRAGSTAVEHKEFIALVLTCIVLSRSRLTMASTTCSSESVPFRVSDASASHRTSLCVGRGENVNTMHVCQLNKSSRCRVCETHHPEFATEEPLHRNRQRWEHLHSPCSDRLCPVPQKKLEVLSVFCLCTLRQSHAKDRRPHPDLDVLSKGSAACKRLCLSCTTWNAHGILGKKHHKEPGSGRCGHI